MSGSTAPDLFHRLHIDEDDGTQSRIARRIDVSCEPAGFPVPPVAVHLTPRVRQTRETGWSLTARMDAGKMRPVVDWLDRWDPARVEPAEGLAPKSLHAEFEEICDPWQILEAVRVDHMVLTPAGTATLVVDDVPPRVDGFVQSMRGRIGPMDRFRVRDYHGKVDFRESRLTRRQEEVVSLAVALGYYEVPRKVDLRGLAEKLELSLGATSELVRRGEAMIVSSYIDALTANEEA